MILHFSFKSSDLSAVIDFYDRYFGTRVIHRFLRDDGSCYGVMLLLGRHSMLEIFEDRAPVPADSMAGPDRTHICIHVADIEKSFRRFPAEAILEPIRRGRTDRALQFRVRDPAGNQIEVQSLDDQVRFNCLTTEDVDALVKLCHATGSDWR